MPDNYHSRSLLFQNSVRLILKLILMKLFKNAVQNESRQYLRFYLKCSRNLCKIPKKYLELNAMNGYTSNKRQICSKLTKVKNLT